MRAYRQVTKIEPHVLDFLKRHRDRLGDTLPAGLWVCEEAGEVLLALTVYVEPKVRVSLLGGSMDGPGAHAASIEKLAREFESWLRPLGVTAYGLLVPVADEGYRRLLERRGAVEVGRGSGQVDYLYRLDVAQDTSDGIRPWASQDWKALRPLMRAFLVDYYASGGDFLPSRRNVELLIQRGVAGSYRGDPAVVAYTGGAPVGFTLWLGAEGAGGLELRERIASDIGTYVDPAHRRQGWATRLQLAAVDLAQKAGYTRVTGAAREERGYKTAASAGFSSAGVLVSRSIDELQKVMVA